MAGIDEAWAAFLEETEAAKDRTEIVSMAGKNYEIEFIRDIAGMYREMQNAVRETAYGRLDRLKNGAENVGNL